MQRDLVERAQRGDREAFAVLAEASTAQLYNLAQLMLADSDLAQDAAQEALIAAWRDLRGLRDPDRFVPWLHRILVHSVYRVAGRERRQIKLANQAASTDWRASDPAHGVADRDEIDGAFRHLTAEHRAVLVVRHYLGMSDDDAADVLGVPAGTYKSRLHRATRALRAELEASARQSDRLDIGAARLIDRRDLDRELAAYLEGRSTDRAPDSLLADALTRIETTRQRPGWLLAEHWLPAPVLSSVGRTTRLLLIVATVVMLVAIVVALTIIVGSQRRLPAPFGIAKPGVIAFDQGLHIFTSAPDGTGQRQLTFGPDKDAGATWSPDGTLIAYASELATDLSVDVIVMGADGSHRVVLATQVWNVGNMSWSPDSRRIAFSATPAGGSDYGIYAANVDDPGATRLGGPDLFGQDPSWSPDGRQIAFKRIIPCCEASDALWIMQADGSGLRQLSTATVAEDNAGWNTAWSPDGSRLAFLARGASNHLDVYIVNADGTGQQDITNSPDDEFWPTWSPDGTLIAYPRMWGMLTNQGTFFVVHPDGSGRIRLNGPFVNSNPAVWSPDGTRLLGYVVDPSGMPNNAVIIFDVTGATPPVTIPIAGYNSITWQRLAP